jgi:hypothetical protein
LTKKKTKEIAEKLRVCLGSPKYAKPKIWQAMISTLLGLLQKLANLIYLAYQIYGKSFCLMFARQIFGMAILVANHTGPN